MSGRHGHTGGSVLNRRHWVTVGDAGNLAVGSGVSRLPIPFDAEVLSCRAMVNTAPTGATAIFDVHKNGTTIFTTQANRPTIPISGFDSGAAVPDVVALVAGDYLTVDIDQIGSTIAGADWTLAVHLERKVATADDHVVLFASEEGTLATGTGTLRLPVVAGGDIQTVRAMVNTAPTGASIILDVNLNGASIYPTSTKPTIAASGTDSGNSTPDTRTVVPGDYLQVDIDQIGSTVAGADLVVAVDIRLIG